MTGAQARTESSSLETPVSTPTEAASLSKRGGATRQPSPEPPEARGRAKLAPRSCAMTSRTPHHADRTIERMRKRQAKEVTAHGFSSSIYHECSHVSGGNRASGMDRVGTRMGGRTGVRRSCVPTKAARRLWTRRHHPQNRRGKNMPARA